MQIETFVVPTAGIGRRDYSQVIEFASQATLRGHQRRMNWTMMSTTLATVPWPDFNAAHLTFFDAAGVSQPYPTIPHHIYSVLITTERQALVLAGLYRFRTWDDVLLWNVDEWHGDIFGYGRAELLYTNGIKTELGKYYIVAFSEYSEEATFTFDFMVSALSEEVVYG